MDQQKHSRLFFLRHKFTRGIDLKRTHSNDHLQDSTGWRYRKDYMPLQPSSLDAIKAAICYT
jgi:hypothetical protein